jgi:hypothetical protein
MRIMRYLSMTSAVIVVSRWILLPGPELLPQAGDGACLFFGILSLHADRQCDPYDFSATANGAEG